MQYIETRPGTDTVPESNPSANLKKLGVTFYPISVKVQVRECRLGNGGSGMQPGNGGLGMPAPERRLRNAGSGMGAPEWRTYGMRHRHLDMQHVTTACSRMILPFENMKNCMCRECILQSQISLALEP